MSAFSYRSARQGNLTISLFYHFIDIFNLPEQDSPSGEGALPFFEDIASGSLGGGTREFLCQKKLASEPKLR